MAEASELVLTTSYEPALLAADAHEVRARERVARVMALLASEERLEDEERCLVMVCKRSFLEDRAQ